MKPPSMNGSSKEWEKVAVGDMIPGVLSEVKYDMEHKSTFDGKEKIGPAVRLIFKLDGYEYPHGTTWLTFNYGEKSNLYKNFLVPLVEGAKPDMTDFDLDNLKGLKVRMVWSENDKGFQKIAAIFPVGAKVKRDATPVKQDPAQNITAEPGAEEEVPF